MSTTYEAGGVTAYYAAKKAGYTGTFAEFCTLMASYATTAQTAVDAAQTATNKAGEAAGSASAASGSANTASAKALAAEGYAEGKQNGTDVASGSPYYHANAKYYKNEAGASATAAGTSETNAAADALKAEGFAVGEQNGSAVASGSPYYQNNAEYYRDKAVEAKNTAESVAASIPQDYSALSAEVLSMFPTDTATGAVASFSDGADNVPVRDLTVAITPVQSGSGDPSPSNVRPISGWTGANVYAGRINWNELRRDTYSTTAADGITTSYNADTHKFCIHNDSRTTNYGSGSTQGVLYLGDIPAGHKLLCVTDADSGVRVELRNGSVQGSTFYTNNIYTTQEAADRLMLRVTSDYDFVSAHPVGSDHYFTMSIFDLTQMFGAGNEPSSVADFRAVFPNLYYPYDPGYPMSSFDYIDEPYTTIPINWQSTAGTVYGGTLDVTSGVLTVTGKKVVYNGSENWAKHTTGSSSAFSMQTETAERFVPDKIYANYLKTISINETWGNFDNWISWETNNQIIVTGIQSITTVQGWKDYLAQNNLEVIYFAETPVTYQLSPTEVKTLLGINNIFADCGDSTVQYRADIQKYINKVIAAAVAAI